jgi:DNA-binding NarL/FixJ family response regulator
MKILLVEDDYLQSDWVYSDLILEFPDAEIEKLSTESEFRSHLDDIAATPPDVILMDIMMRWADPSPNIPPAPEEVKNEGFYRSGLRCIRLLSRSARTSHIPVILYTMLERADIEESLRKLPANVTYMQKESDLTPLFQRIRAVTRIAAH